MSWPTGPLPLFPIVQVNRWIPGARSWRKPAARGDYGGVYDALYETIVNGAPGYVSETDIITNLEILERGFEHASPSIITLDY